MIPESRQVIHVGLNYVLNPLPALTRDKKLDFQRTLEEQGLVPDRFQVQRDGREIVVWSKSPIPLEIKIGAVGEAPIGQLLMIATHPGVFELAQKQIAAATAAFEKTWQAEPRQVLRRDATLRVLFGTSKEHAFTEIWETRLGKNPGELELLGHPVLGGGLRFVMPPIQKSEPVIEVKIESFLSDTSKIFMEAQFIWQDPGASGRGLDPAATLKAVDNYIKESLVPFMAGGPA